MRLRIGAKLPLKPFVLLDSNGHSTVKPITGTLVYINEPHRFFTAEFVFPNGGSFRESFKFHYKSDLLHKKTVSQGGAFRNCRKKFFT